MSNEIGEKMVSYVRAQTIDLFIVKLRVKFISKPYLTCKNYLSTQLIHNI